ADALGEDVADAAELEHGADAATGDHPGPGAGRAQDDVAGAVSADDLVGQGLAVFGDSDQALARVLDRLLNRQRHLSRLAVSDSDHALFVADGDQRGEREPAAALDDLGDAIDLDHALLEVEAPGADRLDVCGVHSLHSDRPP